MQQEQSGTEHPRTAPGGEVTAETRRAVLLLAASVALIMTGVGIVLPVFGKRLGDFGAGPETLAMMTMGFAGAQFVFGPMLGALADRYGRRLPVLIALGGFALANVGLVFAPDPAAFIALRVFEGGVTAGLLPAAMGLVGDLVPEHRRAQYAGIIMASLGAGITFGPVLGGVLYDAWGFAAPFVGSTLLGLVALVFAWVMVPETRPAGATAAVAHARRPSPLQRLAAVWSLPRPAAVFATMLSLDFIGQFAFVFVEPVMVFYVYNTLSFSTTQLGAIFSAYGLMMLVGQMVLGRVGDRFPRKYVIAGGFALGTAFYFSFAVVDSFAVLLAMAAVTGVGTALMHPALSALYLDMADEQDRSRVMGMRESAAALSGVVGPLLAALVSGWVPAQAVFATSGGLVLLAAVVALVGIPLRKQAAAPVTPVPSLS